MAITRTASNLAMAEEQEIVSQLQEIARTRQPAVGLDPAKLVRETHSARIRDAAALALFSLGDPRTAELLTELVTSKATEEHRGTLLYVLNELEASLPLDALVALIAVGPYEAREEALMLLEHAQADDAERSRALTELDRLKQSMDEELSAAASEAIDRVKRR